MSLLTKITQLGENSLLAGSARGLGTLGSGAKNTWDLAKPAVSPLAKGAGNFYMKHPIRNTAVGLTTMAAVGSMGIGGVGPMAGIGDEYKRYMTSRYGDRPEVNKVTNVNQMVATGAGVLLGATAGLGAFGKGPIGWFPNKAPKIPFPKLANPFGEPWGARSPDPFIAVGNAVGEAGEKLDKHLTSAINKIGSIPKSLQNMKMPNMRNIGSYLSDEERFYLNKPLRWGAGLGVAAGATARLAQDPYAETLAGYEGNVQGIRSSNTGGISAELQFSTQDLVFGLHRNNKTMRSRYQ